MPVQTDPGVFHAIQTPPRSAGPKVWPNFNDKVGIALGSLQIVCGLLAVAFSGAAMSLRTEFHEIGTGIWSGIWCIIVFFIATGVCGIIAGKYKTTLTIVTFMWMSIVTASMVCLALLVSSMGMVRNLGLGPDNAEINFGLLGISMAEGVICITSAAFCCAAVCCCRQRCKDGYPNPGMQQQQIYTMINGQVLINGQQVIYNANNNPAPENYPTQQCEVNPVNGHNDMPPTYTP